MKAWGLRAWVLRLPVPPHTRGRLLRRFGATVGSNVRVLPLTVMNAGWSNLVLENDVYIGPDCILDLSAGLTIRQGAVLAAGVVVMTHQDAGSTHQSPTAARLGTFAKPVTIGQHAFLGARAVVLAGCDIGDGAVLGAGAVATRPVEPGITAVGVPARPACS